MEDWDSKHYKEHGLLQQKAAFEILKQLSLRGDESVLDLGCGDGKTTVGIAERVPKGEVLGLDNSPNMIQEARSVYSKVPNLRFLEMSVDSFSFPRQFDLITSFWALHWVEDHSAVLKNARESLKEGGKILFYFVSGGNPILGEVFEREPWRSLMESREKKRGEPLSQKGIEVYRELLKQHGLIEKLLEIRYFSYFFPDLEALSNFFMTWVPSYTRFPKESAMQFSREIAENHALHQKKRENIEYQVSMLYVEAHT